VVEQIAILEHDEVARRCWSSVRQVVVRLFTAQEAAVVVVVVRSRHRIDAATAC
jgi:hypothetical protein